MKVTIRRANGADSEAVADIVRSCWSAYRGVVVDIDREMPELRQFAAHYETLGGEAWVAELEGRIIACLAMTPDEEPGVWMLHKLNVLPEARRHGIAATMVRKAETVARAMDAVRMVLWSDTRFVESHSLYESLGYERMPETRHLNDLSNTEEFRFRKSL